MSILSTNTKLIKVGQDYSAGSGISIDDGVISVTGEFGKTYSAGDNISIYEQDEQLYISSKDWTNDIANASANAYNEAVAQIPDPFDPSYLSAQIDNKLNSSDFTTWQDGQYNTDLQTIEGQINNKLDTSSFSEVSGSFLTAHQSLDGYATEDWVTAQGYITGVDLSNYYTKDETSGKEELAQAFADIPVGDPEVNAYVTDNSATINGTTDLVQNSSGLWNDVAVYQSNSANYLTAHQDLSDYYTTAEADSLSSMFSGAIDYVSANAGSDIVLENTPTGSQNIYTVSSETTALRIKGNEVIDVTNYTSGIFINNYYKQIIGEDGIFEIPFTVSANASDPDAKTLFNLNTSDWTQGGFKANFDTSGNANASGFAFNIVDSNDNIISINSIRNVWGWLTLPNCPVDVPNAGYSNLNENNPISAELSPGDYKLVISSIDAELVPSFSGWYYINVQNRGFGQVSSAPYLAIPNVKLVDSKIDLVYTNLSSNGGYFVVSGGSFDFNVGAGGHLSANNGSTAIFTNGSLVSADGNGLRTKNNQYDIKADGYGLDISSYQWQPLTYRNGRQNITLAANYGFAFNASSNTYSAWIDNYGTYGFSGNGYIGSFGGWLGDGGGNPLQHSPVGVGFSGQGSVLDVHNGGKLRARNQGELDVNFGGHLSANNSCSALFTNGSRTEITNAHTLLVGNNELGTMNGVLVSGNGQQFISIYNGGSVKVLNGTEVNLSANTHKIGTSLNASGSRFISADGEGVSAWVTATMTVMGAYNQTSSNAAFVIGNGTTNLSRSDLFVIDYSGNAQTNDFIAGNGNKLSYSIQTSELEFDSNDSITAINGSAIGGGGVTGEFVPQSAFDELKQSYDALSSLFATYSGQWLLPNEGGEE